MRYLLLSFCLLYASAARADFFKCTDAGGNVTLSDKPCQSGEAAEVINQVPAQVSVMPGAPAQTDVTAEIALLEAYQARSGGETKEFYQRELERVRSGGYTRLLPEDINARGNALNILMSPEAVYKDKINAIAEIEGIYAKYFPVPGRAPSQPSSARPSREEATPRQTKNEQARGADTSADAQAGE